MTINLYQFNRAGYVAAATRYEASNIRRATFTQENATLLSSCLFYRLSDNSSPLDTAAPCLSIPAGHEYCTSLRLQPRRGGSSLILHSPLSLSQLRFRIPGLLPLLLLFQLTSPFRFAIRILSVGRNMCPVKLQRPGPVPARSRPLLLYLRG